jgi:ABC-type lipoprotein export system ATPase subunit
LSTEYAVRFSGVNLYDEARNISLEQLDLLVAPGSFLTVSGKRDVDRTHVLNVMLGMRFARDGVTEVLGCDPRELCEDELLLLRQDIGYVYPRGGMLRNLSVRENILLPLYYGGPAALQRLGDSILDRLEHLAQYFNLVRLLDSDVGALDNFEMKRLLMARAVSLAPRLLLVDEPVTYVEEQDRLSLREIVSRLPGSGLLAPEAAMIISSEDTQWGLQLGPVVEI